jgi:nitrite reductase (NADH) large subunit
MAGARLAEHLVARQQEHAMAIAMFGDEPGGNYNRILLPGVLAGTHAGPDIVTNPVEWYRAAGIRLHAGVRATHVDLERRIVSADGNVREPFDALVFATGSRPAVPTIDGLTHGNGELIDGAFVFRTVDDCSRMAVAAAAARSAVIVGGGLLGLEAARALIEYGIDVTVVHLSTHVMDGQLDANGSGVLRRELERLGLRVLVGRTAVRVRGGGRVEAVELSDGSRLSCELLVIAAGVRANVELAARCGLAVNRGIVVGDDLACPRGDEVYAIGDCAEHRGLVYGLVGPAWEQADILADRLTRRRPNALYRGSRPATKLKVAGLHVAVMGERDPLEDDEVVSYAEPSRGIYSRVIVRDERVTGAIVIGAGQAVPLLVQRFLDGSPVPARRSDLLFPPTGDAPAVAVDRIPDTARICDCNAVVKGQIVEAVLNGARSMPAVCERTRAGTGCGACRPEVQRIVDFVCGQVETAGAARSTGDAALSRSEGEQHASA